MLGPVKYMWIKLLAVSCLFCIPILIFLVDPAMMASGLPIAFTAFYFVLVPLTGIFGLSIGLLIVKRKKSDPRIWKSDMIFAGLGFLLNGTTTALWSVWLANH